MSRPDIPVTISGDDKGFRAAMTRVRSAAGTTAGNVTAAFMRIKMAAGALPAAFTAIGFTGLIAAARDAASAVASIGDEAKRAGLSAKAFQELKFVAEQNRIGVDQLTDGMKELNLRADEFITTGGGAAAEAFKRLGYGAAELKEKLKDPSALFAEIIGRLGQLDKAAQIRVSDEVFGGSAGERFVELVTQGEAGIRKTIKAANDLGLVMSDELIERAAEVDRQFNVIATTVSVKLKGAIVEAAISLRNFMESFSAFEAQSTGALRDRMKLLEGARARASSMKGTTEDSFLSLFGRDSASEMASIDAEMNQLKGILDRRDGLVDRAKNPLSSKSGRVKSATEIMREAMLDAQLKERLSDKEGSGASGSGRGGKAAQNIDKEAAAIKKVVEALQEEIAVIGLSAVEREKLQALREAGVTSASKEGQQISALVEQKHRQLAAEEQLIDARERAQEAAEDFGATLDDQLDKIIDGTFKARDALSALVKELASAMTGGKGLFSGLFSQLFGGGGLMSPSFVPNTTLSAVLGFGGGRAGGGPVSPGRLYEVNENEQEFFVPNTHGNIVAPSKGGGDAVNVSYAPVYNFTGTAQEIEKIKAQAERDRRDFQSRTIVAVRDARNRRLL